MKVKNANDFIKSATWSASGNRTDNPEQLSSTRRKAITLTAMIEYAKYIKDNQISPDCDLTNIEKVGY